jgi:alkanesulfonate monooxygenase SsuD/methylene tetrahydromethanopterin reductase-like flavin-dependent oxidoreductase (luciferase family)
MARLGIVLAPFATLPAAEFVAVVRETEVRGYHAAWTGEAAGYDAFTIIATIASHTARLHVGSAVVPVQTRTPVVLGQTAATLGHLAPGRVMLGIGLSSRVIVGDWHGLAFAPSLQQIREAVLELAGEIADGVVLNWIPPETVPASIQHLEVGAKKAGRTLADFEIASFVRTCVTDDQGRAREALARDITGYATVDAYASFFRAAGFADEVDAVTTAWRAGDRSGAVRQVSPRFLDGLGVVGPEAFCRERIAEFARAGLTQPVIVPFAPGGGGDARAAQLRTLRAFP